MKDFFRSFLLLLARATDRELARHLQFLKVENAILRSKLPKRIHVTPQERNRLLKFGRKLGTAIYELVTIVSPRTFRRWLAAKKKTFPSREIGRPPTEAKVRQLVLRLASENSWGYTRILGELRKLGITTVSRSTVVNILRQAGLDPGPKRGLGTWADFVDRHAATLWACDFFQKRIWTKAGRVDYFLLFFMHVGSRRVHLAGTTAQPDHNWVVQQARNLAMVLQDQPTKPGYLLRDRDSKFNAAFDAVLEAEGADVVKVGPRAPNMNAHLERFMLTLQTECLDHFIVFGEKHLHYLVSEFLAHYHEVRPHQGKDNLPLTGGVAIPPKAWKPKDLACRKRLGGLLKSYSWKAAA